MVGHERSERENPKAWEAAHYAREYGHIPDRVILAGLIWSGLAAHITLPDDRREATRILDRWEERAGSTPEPRDGSSHKKVADAARRLGNRLLIIGEDELVLAKIDAHDWLIQPYHLDADSKIREAASMLEAQAHYVDMGEAEDYRSQPHLRAVVYLRAVGSLVIPGPYTEAEYLALADRKASELRSLLGQGRLFGDWQARVESERKQSRSRLAAKSTRLVGSLPPWQLGLRHHLKCRGGGINSRGNCDCGRVEDWRPIGELQAWIVNSDLAEARDVLKEGVQPGQVHNHDLLARAYKDWACCRPVASEPWDELGRQAYEDWPLVKERNRAEGFPARSWDAHSAVLASMLTFPADPVPARLQSRERLAYVQTKRAVSERGRDVKSARLVASAVEWTDSEMESIGSTLWGFAPRGRPAPARAASPGLIGSATEHGWSRSNWVKTGWGAYQPSVTLGDLRRLGIPLPASVARMGSFIRETRAAILRSERGAVAA